MATYSGNYDLEERTAKFGENIIEICKKINANTITRPLLNQFVRSATSIGANYMEANGASSKKDFRNKNFICKKESQETKHWLRMIKIASKENEEEILMLLKEANELTLIFNKITQTLDKKN
ncbi:MAG: four helix bundle protein [Bacteroidetes bacterium]|nr:four helix bundle protein [Bacteroidota bacterium]